ncbi:phage protease [Pseudomonas aeruginosa]|uniref:phage protease n=1 Tax=Pseudomonas aeruginosa TaxID=287 RepID=UPI003D03C2CC
MSCSGSRQRKRLRCSTTSTRPCGKRENGQPAPAAGFFRALEWREGQGLFAQVELTARAKAVHHRWRVSLFQPCLPVRPRDG